MTFFTGGGPPLVALLLVTALVGFGIGAWIGSQPTSSRPAAPAVLASSAPSLTPSPTATPSPSPTPTAAAASTPARPREIILDISGTEHDVSRSFDALPGWQIQWQTDGTSIAIAVTGDQNLGTVVDEQGPASGVISLPEAGTFQLNVAASGPWTITVVQGVAPTPTPVAT